MNVIQLFVKSSHGVPIQPCDSLTLQQGYGIEGDTNAMIGSPRQVLLASTPTLEQFDLNPGDLQENILINTAVEQFTSGQVLRIGQDALIRLMFLCEPCATLEKIRPGLMKRIKGKRGFLGMVVRDGRIKPGDNIALTDYQFPVLPEAAKGRFVEFVARIELGKVVRTSDLLVALGVTPSYYRAIPTFIKKAATHLPVHRIVASDGSLMTKYIPHQRQILLNEGVVVIGNQVSPIYCWETFYFHDLSLVVCQG
jgi:alkylated DNA nucleotide flippase Atl1